MRRFAVLLLVCVAGRAVAQPAQVIIIRHAEKPDEGNELNERGQERAAALVAYFQGRPEVLQFKTPIAIYAQSPKKEDSSLRPLQTVKPLADALKLSVVQAYTRDEYPKMVEEILSNRDYKGKMVLICWEHKVIPDIARSLRATDAPAKWHGSVFDRTWMITFNSRRDPSFKDLPQRLLFGDSAD
jgi:hypothetical protein